MAIIKDENYINVAGWMIKRLKLKGNELLIYALIYGFSQNGHDGFEGGLSYITQWINGTKQTVITVLKNLIAKELIKKEIIKVGNCTYCKYSITQSSQEFKQESNNGFENRKPTQNNSGQNSLPPTQSKNLTTIQNETGQNSLPPQSKILTPPGQNFLPNTINEILINSTTSKNENKISEVEDLIIKKIKEQFAGHYAFDSSFSKELVSLFQEFEITDKKITEYLEFVMQASRKKQPESLTNMFYTLCKSRITLQDFIVRDNQAQGNILPSNNPPSKNTMLHPTYRCPVCNTLHKLTEDCPECGLLSTYRTSQDKLDMYKKIYALAPEKKSELNLELDKAGKSFMKNHSGLSIEATKKWKTIETEIYSKYGVTI